MWLQLEQGDETQLTLIDRQSIFPAPDGSERQFLITTTSTLKQHIVLATERMARLRYQVIHASATMTLGDQDPVPWTETGAIKGQNFELMLTDRGPLVVPSRGARLPNRLAGWLKNASENVRTCWPVPPDHVKNDTEWELLPAIPGGLPPGTLAAKLRVRYQAEKVEDSEADINVRFGLNVTLDPPTPAHAKEGIGIGEVEVHLNRRYGPSAVLRRTRMELVRERTNNNQIVRSKMEVRVSH